jgi:protein phosphatase
LEHAVVRFDIGQRTDAGGHARNEDALGVFSDERSGGPSRGLLLVVADGTGPDEAGEVASRTAVEAVRQVYFGDRTSSVEQALRRAIETANDAVAYEHRRLPEQTGIGTTVAVICGDELIAANVGDSRVYLRTKNQLMQVTRDHAWDAGSTVATALGVQSQVEVGFYPRYPLQPGDVILVCSDGLWGMVPEDQIASLLASPSARSAADALITAARGAGGDSNSSAIVCSLLAEQGA